MGVQKERKSTFLTAFEQRERGSPLVCCTILISQLSLNQNRRRKSSIGELCKCAGGLYVRARRAGHTNLTKIPLIHSVSYFNLGGLEALFGGA